jgi:hypothetical protein
MKLTRVATKLWCPISRNTSLQKNLTQILFEKISRSFDEEKVMSQNNFKKFEKIRKKFDENAKNVIF